MRFLSFYLFASSALFSADIKQIFPAGAKPVGPYSPGIAAGDYVYVSGQGARDPQGNLPATAEQQTRQTLENIRTILEAAGLTMEHVVYAQVYLADMKNYEAMNKVYESYFPKMLPARATLGVFRMPTETPVEITVVAHRDLAAKRAAQLPGSKSPVPITPAILLPDRFYLSGVLGRDADAGTIPPTAQGQADMVVDRARRVLDGAKLSFLHLSFVNVYYTPQMPRETAESIVNRLYPQGGGPAVSMVQVPELPFGTNISITGVGTRDLSRQTVHNPKNVAMRPKSSSCVSSGNTVYCSLRTAIIPGPNGGIFISDVAGQVRMTMRNLLDGLEETGLKMENVVATNVYLDDINEFQAMNRIYAKYFGPVPPTRTTVEPMPPVARQSDAEGAAPPLVQISLIAVR